MQVRRLQAESPTAGKRHHEVNERLQLAAAPFPNLRVGEREEQISEGGGREPVQLISWRAGFPGLIDSEEGEQSGDDYVPRMR